MPSSFPTISVLLASATLAPHVAGQTGTPPQIHQGLASSLAAGLLLPDSTNPSIRVKAPSSQSSAPPVFDPALHSGTDDYTLAALFQQYQSAGGNVSLIDIDAFSTGADVIPYPDEGGGLRVLNGGTWAAIAISVDRETLGMPGSLIETRRLAGKNSSSDLISYYFAGSTGIDPELRGRTLMEQRAENMGLPDDDLGGLDFALGVAAHLQTITSPLMFPSSQDLYFSITPASASLINQGSASFGGLSSVDPAAIYHVQLNGSTWSAPVVYRAPVDLGLGPGADVDALAVDESKNVVIFSTDVATSVTNGWTQLRVQWPGDAVEGPVLADLREEVDEATVTQKIGINNDETENVDAVCGYDPEPGQLFKDFGVSGETSMSVAQPFGLSMTRAFVLPPGSAPTGDETPPPAPEDRVLLQATGWGDLAAIQSGDVHFLLRACDSSIQGSCPAADAPWVTVAVVSRAANQDLVETSFVYPQGWPTTRFEAVAVFTGDDGVTVLFSWMVAFG